MTKLLGITGSLRRASSNTGLLRALKNMAPAHVSLEIATLHGIPMFNEDDEAATGKPDSVKALEAKIRAADGIIIACPEYNFSVPGVLKNANDWLSRGGSPFRWKRVGIAGAGGGQFVGTARAQYHLRQNLQALQAITMPRPEVFVNHNEEKFDADGNLTDAETKRYLAKWLEAFLEWVEKRP
ncbi:NADPH-dependent FMN reductase [Aestuariivirga sp.]|uniref:NADPH-dependent FMN reductase n=1 Tax=Aestuariivirga sp. TaxID=2650926 RepID=UPI0025C4CAEC|nr:NADPH-dependent FMN reductase [Aestuariivirga sp.]MCA3554927.1 NAD(P)H-dependent oxidoreductase [Aestuariivirga sp.]